jgi:hypothetical protein
MPTAMPTAMPTEPPSAGGDLLEPGRRVTLPIVSSAGVSGMIALERGEDVGGYPLIASPASELHFFVEVRATYELEGAPETASWGELDWRMETEAGPVGELLRAFPQPAGRNYLGTWPGATVPERRYEGWLIFVIPRDLATSPLDLVYQPPGVAESTRIAVRRPGAAPEAVQAVEWPRPDPVYVAQPGLPITVLESSEADALFTDPDSCTNEEDGYTVSYPDSWYTNTAIGDVPACSWFSPTFYEATGDTRPDEIAIEISVFEGDIGFIWVDLYSEEVRIGGFSGRRYETGMTKDPEQPTNTLQYSYLAILDPEGPGDRKLWAFTGTDYGGEYELNRAVFDRIMASLRFMD